MNPLLMPRGPVMIDVKAFHLDEEEKQRLLHPAIGGVILFRRNYKDIKQLKELVTQIKSLRDPSLIIAVDHEGGRVQRFQEGFTKLPAMNVLGNIWDKQGANTSKTLAKQVGWVLATELVACGIDLSFTPILDLNWGHCAVIGNRSFHQNASVVTELALALQKGLNRGGMKACGKHFPGHGFVQGDSHLVLPEDHRTFAELEKADLIPFEKMAQAGMDAIMPAHVIYPQIDVHPAGFSAIWLKQILRQKMGFDGMVFSDDLTMEGASTVGNIKERAKHAFSAGCDVVLVCNRPDWVDELLEDFYMPQNTKLAQRWHNMSANISAEKASTILASDEFQLAQNIIGNLASPKDIEGGIAVGEAF